MFSFSGLSRPANSEGAGAGKMTALVGMGWRFLNMNKNLSPATPTCNYANSPLEPMQRWRATDPGKRSVKRFTRNINVESGPKDYRPSGRHVIWSFNPPPALDEDSYMKNLVQLDPLEIVSVF